MPDKLVRKCDIILNTDQNMNKAHIGKTQEYSVAVAYPEIFFGRGSTNSVDRGQTEQGSGDGSPLVRGSAQFVNG
jgi:hypothetical protein